MGVVAVDQPNPYVHINEHGVYRVGDSRVMFDSVLAGFDRGDSPEWIRQQYRSLSLEQVYGSIAYYLGHREEIDAYLKRQEAVWDEFRKRCDEHPAPVVERLRALQRAKVGDQR
jgi:uncharacterized protein (DUF433 family)